MHVSVKGCLKETYASQIMTRLEKNTKLSMKCVVNRIEHEK